MTTLNSFYAQAAAVTNLDQRRWALGAAYRIGEYVRFGYSIGAARALVLASTPYANGLVAAGLDDEYAVIDDVGTGSPPAVPFVQDTFAGAPGTSLQTHAVDIGGPCVRHPLSLMGAVITDAGRARANANNTLGLYYWTADPAGAEYDVQAEFFAASVTANIELSGIGGRCDTAAETLYLVCYDKANTRWQLAAVNAGALTSLGTFAQTLTAGQTYTVKLEIRNAAKKVFIDGVERISSADNTITAAGKAAYRPFTDPVGNTNGMHIDNVVATNA